MLRHARTRGVAVDWTFYPLLSERGDRDGEAEQLGARIVRSPAPIGQKLAFARALRAELRRGRYDVLHCHHDVVSALYLAASEGLPIRRRLVHVHNADESTLTPNRLKQIAFRTAGRRICLARADRIVGISNHTLDTFLDGRPRRAGRDRVHYYGIDPSPFAELRGDRAALRRALGLPADALVLLFAGRMVPEKNPLFAAGVLAALRRIDRRVFGVFAGAGGLEPALRARVRELGLDDAVRMVGWRDDVGEVMAASDWFILPRPDSPEDAREGFGIAVIEAQLAGLRLLLSNAIAPDPLLPGATFRQLGLSAGPDAWAAAAVEMLPRSPDPAAARDALRLSPMDLDAALGDLMDLHA